MRTIPLEEVTGYDIHLSGIVCFHQLWTSKHHSFSYLDSPRPTSGLIYIDHGHAHYRTPEGNEINAGRGDILYLPQGSRYFVQFVPSEARSFLLNFELSYHGEPFCFSNKLALITHDTEQGYYERFCALCFKYIGSTDRLAIKAMLFELISLLSLSQANTEHPSDIHVALSYINNHLNAPLSITELAKMCAMSESTFRRAFIEVTGQSPKKYINQQKIQKAKKLLQSSELTVSGLCDTLGFYDSAYFVKLFKKHTGLTPLAYRRSR